MTNGRISFTEADLHERHGRLQHYLSYLLLWDHPFFQTLEVDGDYMLYITLVAAKYLYVHST